MDDALDDVGPGGQDAVTADTGLELREHERHVERREQCHGEHGQVATDPELAEEVPDMGVPEGDGGQRASVTAGRRDHEVGVHHGALQSGGAEGDESLEGWRAGSERRRPRDDLPLPPGLAVVEQRRHEPGPAAEPAEDGALADAGLGRDLLHRHGLDTVAVDQAVGRIEEQLPVAGGVAPFGSRVRVEQDGAGHARDPRCGSRRCTRE